MSRGVVLGVGMFLVEDEFLNTVMGTAAEPRKYPWQAHARGLITHLVLGVVTEAALSAFDRAGATGKPDRSRREASGTTPPHLA